MFGSLRHRVRERIDSMAKSRRSRVSEALTLLTPFDVGFPLLRLGSSADGGYLVPNDLDGISALFSPGVSTNTSFEEDAGHRGIPSHLLDGSIADVVPFPGLASFEPLWLSSRAGPKSIPLEAWVGSRSRAQGDLMLQMDIEGAEFAVLRKSSERLLSQFRIIVVEFHGMQQMKHAWSLHRHFLPVLRKLNRLFYVAHLHVNNCCGSEEIYGFRVPRVIEVTYIRRDRVHVEPSPVPIPHALDADCVPEYPSDDLAGAWPIPAK